jgi:phosphate-selective porin OprO/OprP
VKASSILLLAAATICAPAVALAAPPPAEPQREYGIFEPVTIDPPPDRPQPSATEPAAPIEAPATEPAAPIEAPAEPEPPPPTLGNLDQSQSPPLTQHRYKIGKGFMIGTKDGRYTLWIRARLQVRYDLDHPNVEGEEVVQTFQMRRARVLLAGNVFSPHIRYYIQFGFSPRDMSNDLPSDLEDSIRRNPLRDARIEIVRLRDFNIWIGQSKVPFSRQRRVSSSALNMVDRSLVNSEFSLDRDIGIQALSTDLGGIGKLAYYLGVHMGEGRNAFESRDAGLLYVARFEVTPFGKFEDYVEGDTERMKKPGLSIGAAYAFHDRAHAVKGVGGDPPADGGTTNFHHFTADLMFKWHGFSLLSGFHLRRGFARKNGGELDEEGLPIPTVPARSGIGWYGQLGWLVPKIPLEFVTRYGMTRNIYGAASTQPDNDEAGVGVNYYFVGHNLKLQFDYFRLWGSALGGSFSEQARHGTDRIRVQVQLYF